MLRADIPTEERQSPYTPLYIFAAKTIQVEILFDLVLIYHLLELPDVKFMSSRIMLRLMCNLAYCSIRPFPF